MKVIVGVVLALVITSAPVFAQSPAPSSQSASRPTDESLRQLLGVMEAKKLVEGMPHQVDTMMAGMMQKLLDGQPVSPQQRQAIDSMRTKVHAFLKNEFGWDVMDPHISEDLCRLILAG